MNFKFLCVKSPLKSIYWHCSKMFQLIFTYMGVSRHDKPDYDKIIWRRGTEQSEIGVFPVILGDFGAWSDSWGINTFFLFDELNLLKQIESLRTIDPIFGSHGIWLQELTTSIIKTIMCHDSWLPNTLPYIFQNWFQNRSYEMKIIINLEFCKTIWKTIWNNLSYELGSSVKGNWGR